MKKNKQVKKLLKAKPKKKVILRNPGLYAEIKNKEISHNDVTKEEFMERENQSYGMDLGGDCNIKDSEIKNNLK